MIKYVFRNSAEYFNFIDQLARTRNEPGAVANNKLTVRTVNYIYSRTSGLNQYFDMYLYHWTLDDIQEAIESPVYIRPDGYVALEMPEAHNDYEELDIASMYPTEFFDRKLAARWLVNTLEKWCENQGYIMRMVIYKLDHVEFTIDYMGRSGCYHIATNQLDYVNDAKKRVETVMEHFENNYGKRAEFAETHHLPVGIVQEVKLASKTRLELDIARDVQLQMYKRLLNSQYGLEGRNMTIDETHELFEACTRIKKEVNDSMFKRIPDITKVIHNDPATIVFWSDGTKTVVKAENEAYDPEKGIAMAITKKVLGNKGNYYNTIRKWLPKEEE